MRVRQNDGKQTEGCTGKTCNTTYYDGRIIIILVHRFQQLFYCKDLESAYVRTSYCGILALNYLSFSFLLCTDLFQIIVTQYDNGEI